MTQIPMLVQTDPEDQDCADIMVPGSIGGRNYWFRLDTGAAVTDVITDEHLAALAVTRSGSSAGAFGQADRSDIVVLPDLVLGDRSIPSLEVRRVPSDSGRQNLLGMDVLGRYCCRFRFDAGLLELTSTRAERDELPLELTVGDRGHPYVELHWAGAGRAGATPTTASASACFDSGAGLTVVDLAFHDRHRELFTTAGQAVGTDSTGTSAAAPMFWLAAPSIAGLTFPPAKVAVLDLAPVNRDLEFPMDVILGAPTISRANWLFDFPARRWAVPQLISS